MSEAIGFLIHDTARLFRRELNERMRHSGVTALQWRLLAYLARNEGTNQVKLAEFLEVEPITLSRMIDRLADAGMLSRRRDPDDRAGAAVGRGRPGCRVERGLDCRS